MATLDLTDAPLDGDMAVIMSGLMSFNASDVGPPERRSLAVFIRGDDGKVIGGLLGVTAWGWLFTQWLFVPEALRGREWPAGCSPRRKPKPWNADATAPGSTPSIRTRCEPMSARAMWPSVHSPTSRPAAAGRSCKAARRNILISYVIPSSRWAP